ncbi:MAG: hypothetical protein IJ599_03050 [Alphaproteobacteria bacterium]|nr:hypothetical protein [Alphaproteobacteria bacterium]
MPAHCTLPKYTKQKFLPGNTEGKIALLNVSLYEWRYFLDEVRSAFSIPSQSMDALNADINSALLERGLV